MNLHTTPTKPSCPHVLVWTCSWQICDHYVTHFKARLEPLEAFSNYDFQEDMCSRCIVSYVILGFSEPQSASPWYRCLTIFAPTVVFLEPSIMWRSYIGLLSLFQGGHEESASTRISNSPSKWDNLQYPKRALRSSSATKNSTTTRAVFLLQPRLYLVILSPTMMFSFKNWIKWVCCLRPTFIEPKNAVSSTTERQLFSLYTNPMTAFCDYFCSH